MTDIVEQLRCHFADCDGTCVTVVAANEIVRLRVLLDAIDILHQPWPNQRQCVECGLPWPCKTSRLVTGKEL